MYCWLEIYYKTKIKIRVLLNTNFKSYTFDRTHIFLLLVCREEPIISNFRAD